MNRTDDPSLETPQRDYVWTPRELYMVLDAWTGQYRQIVPGSCVGTLKQALAYIEALPPKWVTRLVMIRADSIQAVRQESTEGIDVKTFP